MQSLNIQFIEAQEIESNCIATTKIVLSLIIPSNAFLSLSFAVSYVTVLVANTWSEGDGSEFPTSATIFQYLGTLEKYQQNSGDGRICFTDL